MRFRASLLALIAAAAAAGPVHAFQRSGPASVFATIGHSEWCPPGTVRLDLASGRYTVRAPRTWRTCRRPLFPSRVSTATLDPDRLARVRAAWRDAVSEGLESPACRNGGRPEGIILSNGGEPSLRLADRGRALVPPRDVNCWSAAAWRLHRLLEDLFDPDSRRR